MQILESIPFVSFLFILIFLIGKIQVLKKKGTKVSSVTQKIKKPTFLLYMVFGLIFLIWFFEIINPFLQLSFSMLPEILTKWLFESIFLKISGTVLILLALILLAITLIHFNNSLRFGLDEKNIGTLITTGIFSISRNPFFVSIELYLVGTTLILTSLFFLIITLLSIISIHFFILKEEKFMQKVYGEEYENYTDKVGRYLSF